MAVLASVSVAVLHEVDDGAPSDCSSSAYSSPARGLKHCGSPARQGAAEGRQPGPQQAATRTGPRATHRVPSYHLSNGSKRASTAWHRAPRPLNTTRPSPRAPLDDRVYRPGRPPSPHAKPRNLRRDERISRNGREVRAPLFCSRKREFATKSCPKRRVWPPYHRFLGMIASAAGVFIVTVGVSSGVAAFARLATWR